MHWLLAMAKYALFTTITIEICCKCPFQLLYKLSVSFTRLRISIVLIRQQHISLCNDSDSVWFGSVRLLFLTLRNSMKYWKNPRFEIKSNWIFVYFVQDILKTFAAAAPLLVCFISVCFALLPLFGAFHLDLTFILQPTQGIHFSRRLLFLRVSMWVCGFFLVCLVYVPCLAQASF